jgi:hypothetical protein
MSAYEADGREFESPTGYLFLFDYFSLSAQGAVLSTRLNNTEFKEGIGVTEEKSVRINSPTCDYKIFFRPK